VGTAAARTGSTPGMSAGDRFDGCVPSAGASTARKEVNRDDALRLAELRPRGVAEAGGSDDGRVRRDPCRDHARDRGRSDRSFDRSPDRDHRRCEVPVARELARESGFSRTGPAPETLRSARGMLAFTNPRPIRLEAVWGEAR